MADSATIEEPQVDDQQQNGQPAPDGGGNPSLPPDKYKELHGIISNMIINKEPEENIKKVVDFYGQKYGGGNTGQPKAAPIKSIDFNQELFNQPNFVNKDNATTPQSDHANAVQKSIGNIQDFISTNKSDKAIDKINSDEYGRMLRDNANASRLNNNPNPEIAPLVFPDDVKNARQAFREDAMNDADKYRHVLNVAKKDSPDLAADAYVADSKYRGANAKVILENAEKIKNGEYDYDIRNRQLIKKEGPIDAAVSALENHSDLTDKSNFLIANDKKGIIDRLEKERTDYDPDKPVGKPNGNFADISSALASQAVPTLKAAGSGLALSAVPELAPAAPWLSGIFTATDFAQQAHASKFWQRYNELRDKGVDPSQAYETANSDAKFSAAANFAQGVALTALGGKLGTKGKVFSPVSFSQPAKDILTDLLSSAKGGLEHIAPHVGAGAVVAGGTKMLENAKEGKPLWEGVPSSAGDAASFVSGTAVLSAGLGALLKGGKNITQQARKVLLDNFSKLPENTLNEGVGRLVTSGAAHPNEATELLQELNNHKPEEKGYDENDIKDLNLKGTHLSIDRPNYEDYRGEGSKAQYEADRDAHHDNVDKTIASIKDNGILTDSKGKEYEVESTPNGVNIKSGDKTIYEEGKRVSEDSPFAKGFKFGKEEGKITTFSDETRNVESTKSGSVTKPENNTENGLTVLKNGNDEIKDIEHDLKNGDRITANIGGQKETGTVIGVGKHKGQIVIDFKDKDGNERFVYSHQIENIERGKTDEEPLTISQKSRLNELINKDELTADEIKELGNLHDINDGKITNPEKELPSSDKNIIKNKTEKNAIQEPSAGGVLQHPQEGTGSEGSGRGRVERGDQGDEPTEKIGGNGEPPTEKESENPSEEKAPRIGGIAQRIQEKLGLRDYEAGKGWSKEDSLDFGRAAIAHGIDPVKVFEDPKYTDLEPHERLALAQAHAIDLSKEINQAGDSGNEKLQAEKEKELSDYQKLIQPAKTKSSQAFTAQQGEFDTDLDSFTSVKNKISQDKPLDAGQIQKVKRLTTENKNLQDKVTDLEGKLKEATDKELGSKEKGKPTRARLSTQLNDIAKRLRTSSEFDSFLKGAGGDVQKMGIDLPKLKEIAASILEDAAKAVKAGENAIDFIREAVGKLKEDVDKDKLTDAIHAIGEKEGVFDIKETAEEKNIKRLEKQLSDLQEGKAKNAPEKRELSEREKELQDQIFEAKKKLGLISGKKTESKTAADLKEEKEPKEDLGQQRSKMDKPLTEQEQIEENEANLKTLQEKLVDKKGNKFTPEESKAIWDHMKQNYLDKGIGFRDAIIDVSNDTGLSFEQVSNAIVTPKTKPISDAMWKSRYDLTKNRAATERYIKEQGENKAIQAVKKFTNVFRELSVFGHGGVFVGTHAGMTLMDLPRAKYTVRAFLNAYKFAYALTEKGTARYEKAMEQLKSEDNYDLAQRAGLRNNPDRLNNDSEIIKPLFGKFSESGVRGFNAIKVLRQALFDSHYNALSDNEKQNPNSAKAIARLVNNATGASNLDLTIKDKEGNVKFDPNEFLFAGGMEAARWGKLTRNPIEATKTAITALTNPQKASIEDKVFAKVWAKRVGSELATFAGLLTVNAALQHVLNKGGNPVNLTNPTKSDWLKIKIGNTTFDFTSGMLSTLHFMENVAYEPFKKSKDDVATREGKDIFKYARGKLSPFYGDVTDAATSHDFSGNTLPWSDAKPLNKFSHKMTWEEYAESKLPLPVAEGFRAFYESAHQNGLNKNRIDNILDGLKYGAISGTTGFKAYENNEGENKPKAKPHS